MNQNDLTQVAQTARRGLKRDVRALCEAIPAGALLLPLARALRPESGEYETKTAENVALHLLGGSGGGKFGAAFTRDVFLSQCGVRMRWTTDGGPLQYARFEARVALQVLGDLAAGARIQGAAINPMQPGELVLEPGEIAKLLQGESFPMPRYIGNLPVQHGERFLEGLPAHPPPAELVAALDAVVGGGMLSYKLRQVFNEERDLEPHLLLRVQTNLPKEQQPGLAERIHRAVQGKVPPPGYLDTLFEQPESSE